MFVRYQLLAKLVKMWKEDSLLGKIDRMLLDMYPRKRSPKGRCCVYKERAVMKYKTMAMLGFDMSDEVDEGERLSSYVQRMLDREQPDNKRGILSVMDEACSSCVKINYEITDLCRGCVARPCYTNCPKDAAADTLVVVDVCLAFAVVADGILGTVGVAGTCNASAAKVCNLVVDFYAR